MKKLLFSAIILMFTALVIMAFSYPSIRQSGNKINPPQDKVEPVFPEAVQKIFETSCFDCHGEASENTKALGKLDLAKWNNYSDAKKIAKMQDIDDVVSKGDMPPGRYIENHPDRAPGQEQKDIINKWATEESARLMNK